MLNFDQILKTFSSKVQTKKRAILREYIQYKMLEAIFRSQYASKLSFMGGTALHICYGSERFSEDLDFDNFGITENEFDELAKIITKHLENDGFDVEFRTVFKGAYRCYLKIPKILQSFGLSPLEEEKILLQIDTTAQDYPIPENYFNLNFFGVYQDIRVNGPEILLAQKLITILERKRLKGRDLYDASFLSGFAKPDEDYLKAKKGVDFKGIQREIINYLQSQDLNKLAKDVAPFLYNPEDAKRVENFVRDFEGYKIS